MNSSTKIPPAGPLQKFKFDMDFEIEAERLRLEMLRQEELARQNEEQQYKTVTYSENELTSARQESFQLGHEQGMSEAKKLIEHTLSDLTDRMLGKLQNLLHQEDQRWNEARVLSISTAVAVLKKFWPQVMHEMGAQIVEETIRQSLQINNDEARIVVRVHDSLLDAVVSRLPQLKEQEVFSGKIIVLADDHVAAGDCKVEWADGGLERLGRTLSAQLDEALHKILAGLPQGKTATNTTTQTETERMSS